MSVFTVTASSQTVQLGTAAPAATDAYQNGVLTDATNVLNRASVLAGAQWSNGVFRLNTGEAQYVDATLGLPADTQFVNGLPYSGGALCTSTNAVATYSNGIPMAANGAVCVGIVP